MAASRLRRAAIAAAVALALIGSGSSPVLASAAPGRAGPESVSIPNGEQGTGVGENRHRRPAYLRDSRRSIAPVLGTQPTRPARVGRQGRTGRSQPGSAPTQDWGEDRHWQRPHLRNALGTSRCGAGDATATASSGWATTSERLVPTRVGTDKDWVRIALGAVHTCGVRTDRSLWCWGEQRVRRGSGWATGVSGWSRPGWAPTRTGRKIAPGGSLHVRRHGATGRCGAGGTTTPA